MLFHVAVDQATTGASWARAEANFTEAIRLATETGQATELAMSLAGLARLDARAGRAEACRAHAAAAQSLCAARDIHVGEVWVAHAVGDLELSLGHPDLAVERFAELSALLERLALDDADLAPGPELVDALLRLGRRDEAIRRRSRLSRGSPPRRGSRGLSHVPTGRTGLAAADDEFEAMVRVRLSSGTRRPSTGSRRHEPASRSARGCVGRDGGTDARALLRASARGFRRARRGGVARSGRGGTGCDRRARAGPRHERPRAS